MVNSAGSHRAHDVLISGAGTAGQSLAYWLRRYGFRPTVVERAPAPRSGGFAVDLRGAAVPVAAHMGILDDLRRVRVSMREIVHVDHHGEIVWKTDGNFGSGEGTTMCTNNFPARPTLVETLGRWQSRCPAWVPRAAA